MRAVVQKVSSSTVDSEGVRTGEIGKGLCVLLGVTHSDTREQVEWLADKIINLRIFEDENDKLNLSLRDVNGDMMIVSQFTLYGSCRRGRRPSFSEAARPEQAEKLYDEFVGYVKEQGISVATGVFQTDMSLALVNEGPVTLIVDTPEEKK